MKTCKRCKGTGFIETKEKQDKILGMIVSNSPRVICPKCYGKGSR